jgi:hypothetical protein
MSTIYNPYSKPHSWFYQGSVPTIVEHEIVLKYLQGRFKRELSRDPTI